MRHLLTPLLLLMLAVPVQAQTAHIASVILDPTDVEQHEWTYVHEHAPDTSVAVMREIRRHKRLAEAAGVVLAQDTLLQVLAEIEAYAQEVAAQRDSAFALADARGQTITEQDALLQARADTIAAQQATIDEQQAVLSKGRHAALATLDYFRALVGEGE